MLGYPEDPRSFALARGLAARGGFDLRQAVLDGLIRRDELQALVATCHDCAAGAPCEHRVPGQGGDVPGVPPLVIPEGCDNASRFAALFDLRPGG